MIVSIAITTYNHERYIAQCIESVLMQIVDFKYEIIIGEDCGTDKTLQICKEYASRYPEKIKLLERPQNLGLRKNNIEVWSSCKGKYIAYLEGDDFWTDENKLQKQVNYLENHPFIIASGHQTYLWCGENSPKNRLFSNLNDKHVVDFQQNIEKWLFATCSFVFKNFFIDTNLVELKNNFKKDILLWSDRPLMVMLSLYGNFIYHEENMACWRQHENNMTKKGDLAAMNVAGARAYKKIAKMYPLKRKKIKELVLRWYFLAAEESLKKNKFFHFIKYSFLGILNISSLESFKNAIKCNYFMVVGKKIYN